MPDQEALFHQMKLFLEPHSIALVGASRQTGSGNNVLENLLDDGYRGQLYPVNPNTDEILGVKTYHTIDELPRGLDLALISLPRNQVPQAVQECTQRGIKALIVVAAGLADLGVEGARIQQEIVRLARQGGARVLGPNTFGVANSFINLNTAFVRFKLQPIPIVSIGQSGIVFSGTVYRRLLGKAVDLGNTCDVDFCDCVEYFGADPQVKIILLYVEDVKDGWRFMSVARKVALRKPIIALKGASTPVGAVVSLSHTGSMAGRAELYDAAFRQCGVIQAADFDELDDLVLSLWHLPLPRGRRVAIVTISMGAGVLAADACASHGLELAHLSPETKEKLAVLMLSFMVPGNPVDLGASQFVEPDPVKVNTLALHALLADPGVDAVLCISPARAWAREAQEAIAQATAHLAARYPTKPVLGWIYAADVGGEIASLYMRAGNVACFPTVERAARALSRLADYASLRRDGQGEATEGFCEGET